jgi:hypothetical protein
MLLHLKRNQNEWINAYILQYKKTRIYFFGYKYAAFVFSNTNTYLIPLIITISLNSNISGIIKLTMMIINILGMYAVYYERADNPFVMCHGM